HHSRCRHRPAHRIGELFEGEPMKKTEKIEIRVSPEDKAALMRLSEQGGRSVSETVRGLLLNQSDPANPQAAGPSAPEPVMSKIQKLAYGAGGAVLGAALATAAMAGLNASQPRPTDYALNIVVLDGPETERRAFEASTVVTLDQMTKTHIRMPTSTADAYQINIDMKRQPDGSIYASFSLCRESVAVCTELAKPALVAARDASASLNVGDNAGRQLMITMSPTNGSA
ncbi:MAG: hypothetical protein ABMA14_22210, partial [Hyphomonadaceae bacterium]